MKILALFTAFGIAAVFVTGCVKTVSGKNQFALSPTKDRIEGRYERPVSKVYEAAKEVLQFNGLVTMESTITATNSVRALEGKVNQRNVYIRVEQLDPKITQVTVQARTKWGGTDRELVHELEKEIALKLVR